VTTTRRHDLVIVGAGVAGLLLAVELAQKIDVSIGLIESGSLPNTLAQEASLARVSALNLFSQRVLKKGEVWSQISEYAAAYDRMVVWDEVQQDITFSAGELNADKLGYIIPNERLRVALYAKLTLFKNVIFYEHVALKSMVQNQTAVLLETDDGRYFESALLVGADGANSFVKRQLQCDQVEWDYGHTAIVAEITLDQTHQQTAWQKFLPTGPVALLPLPQSKRCSLVWSTTPEQATALMQSSDADFAKQLTVVMECRVGQVIAVGKRHTFPLKMRHCKQYVHDRIVLLGDAAHTIHPMAGQGLNLAIQDVMVLSEQLIKAYKGKLPLAARRYLRAFERARKADNWQMIVMLECLRRLFGAKTKWQQWILSLGLGIVRRQSSLKHYLMHQAQGNAREDDLDG